MIDTLRQLLLSVTAAAILGGVALQFVSEGPLKEAVRIAAGLMMTLALLLPLARMPGIGLSGVLDSLQSAAAFAAAENQRIAASSVGNAIAVYIQDRASEMGVKCTASVRMESDASGKLATQGVTLWFEGADDEARSAVCQMVAQECGIPIYLMEVEGR